MKKLISLILILCMACMLIPATAESAELFGDWYLIEMITGETSINPVDMGINWVMTFAEDGTVTNVMEMMGEKDEKTGTWTVDGDVITITIDDQPVNATITDGKLVMDANGQTGIFSKEAPAAAAKPAAVAAESEDVFLGEWEISAVEMFGMYFNKDMFGAAGMEGFSVNLTIGDGKVTVVSQTSAEAQPDTQEFTYTFEEGKLVIPIDLGDSAAAAESLGLDLSSLTDGVSTIELLDNGGLLYGMNFMGMTISVYLVQAGAAEEAPAA